MKPGLAIVIVIVNWNAGQQLRDCIASLGRASHAGLRLRKNIKKSC
jgi:GT2 family glycosyltransferase